MKPPAAPAPAIPRVVTCRSAWDNRQAARFAKNAGFKVETTTHDVGHVTLPTVGRVRFALSRDLPSAPSSVTVVREADGAREKVANPRHFRARQRKLGRAQRALARKEKGSANRGKARVRVAVEHRKTREARQDCHHQLAARLVRENQAIAVEKLNVVGLARSGAKGARGRGLRRLSR